MSRRKRVFEVGLLNLFLGVLERWCERESIRCSGRSVQSILPDPTYKWEFNKKGNLVPVAEGYCIERSTKPYTSNPQLDEFEFVLRGLHQTDQALVIVGYMGREDEWFELVGVLNRAGKLGNKAHVAFTKGGAMAVADQRLKVATLRLILSCRASSVF